MKVKFYIVCFLGFAICACTSKEEKHVVATNRTQESNSQEILPELKEGEMINDQLQLIGNYNLIDVKKKKTLIDFHPTIGDVELQKPNDTTLVFKCQYANYYPIILIVNFTKNKYDAHRDVQNQIYPKMREADFTSILKKFQELKKDSSLSTYEEFDESIEHSAEEEGRYNQRSKHIQETILEFDEQLLWAAINGSKECKKLFLTEWPDLISANMLGYIDEQHSWNESLLEEFERTLE